MTKSNLILNHQNKTRQNKVPQVDINDTMYSETQGLTKLIKKSVDKSKSVFSTNGISFKVEPIFRLILSIDEKNYPFHHIALVIMTDVSDTSLMFKEFSVIQMKTSDYFTIKYYSGVK